MGYADPIQIVMLPALSTTLDLVSQAVPLNNTIKHWHGVTFSSGVSAGTVIIEMAPTRDYAGVWDPLATIPFGAADSAISDIPFEGPGGFVRHRISVAVVGGTVKSVMRRLMESG